MFNHPLIVTIKELNAEAMMDWLYDHNMVVLCEHYSYQTTDQKGNLSDGRSTNGFTEKRETLMIVLTRLGAKSNIRKTTYQNFIIHLKFRKIDDALLFKLTWS